MAHAVRSRRSLWTRRPGWTCRPGCSRKSLGSHRTLRPNQLSAVVNDRAIRKNQGAARALDAHIPQDIKLGLRSGGADANISEVLENTGVADRVVVQKFRDVTCRPA